MSKYPEQESTVVELKLDIPKNDQIIKTIIGFCNQKGGKLVIGVNDNRQIIGLDEPQIEQAMESIDKAIYQACSPTIIPSISTQRYGNKVLLIIEVSSGMLKPYFRKSEGRAKGTYIRVGRNTVRANEKVLFELELSSKGISFEKLPVLQSEKKRSRSEKNKKLY